MSKHRLSTLPTAEVCARVAIAAAGLSGHRTIGNAITARGSAVDLIADCYDRNPLLELDDTLAHRLRTLGRPGVVASILDVTTQLGMQVLTPDHDMWPHQLDGLRAAAPVALWLAGDPLLLEEPPIVVTGNTNPNPTLRYDVVDLSTRIADDGWTVATTSRPGVDQLVHHSTVAMGGDLVTVATTARRNRSELEVVVSENPPLLPVVLASAMRAPILLAAFAGKVLVAGSQPGSGAMRTGIAAHALCRPLGVVGHETGRAGEDPLHQQFGAPVVGTLAEVERLI